MTSIGKLAESKYIKQYKVILFYSNQKQFMEVKSEVTNLNTDETKPEKSQGRGDTEEDERGLEVLL